MISRNAQLVAIALFPMGSKSSTVFKTPSRITNECLTGINELMREKMIESLPAKEIPRGAVGWRGTEKIGFPMTDFDRPTLDECFYLVDGEQNG